MFYNVICEEISILGGKIIHEDITAQTLSDIFEFIEENTKKHPNSKIEIYPFSVTIK